MFSDRKRQQSLRQLPNIKKHETFTSAANTKILPTISQLRENKKNSTKDLTNVISKFTNNNQKQNLYFSEELLRSALSVIKGFSQTENNFQQLFTQLYKVIKRFSFVVDDPEIQQILNAYSVKQGFSFRRTCIMLDNQLQNVMREKNEMLKISIQKNQNLINELRESKSRYQKQKQFLEGQVERYKKLADIEYMKSLQQTVEYLKTNKQQLQSQCNRLNKVNQQYLKQLDNKQNTIQDQIFQIAKLKSQLYDARVKIDKDELYFNKMRDRFDGLLVKMIGMKEVITKVQQQNNTLVSQRMKMVNRAAVAFEDLTPRPKYHSLFPISAKAITNSTQQIVQNLVQKLQGSNSKQFLDKVVLKKKSSKLEEIQVVRDKVANDIIQAKKQMDKLQNR